MQDDHNAGSIYHHRYHSILERNQGVVIVSLRPELLDPLIDAAIILEHQAERHVSINRIIKIVLTTAMEQVETGPKEETRIQIFKNLVERGLNQCNTKDKRGHHLVEMERDLANLFFDIAFRCRSHGDVDQLATLLFEGMLVQDTQDWSEFEIRKRALDIAYDFASRHENTQLDE